VELVSGEGLTVRDGLGAGVGEGAGRLACISRRRAAMRSTRDCPALLCSEMLGAARSLSALRLSGLTALSLIEGVRLGDGVVNSGRDGLIAGDRSGVGDGLGVNDGAGALGVTEVLGRLGLMDGADRLIDGLGALKDGLGDGLGRLGVNEGLGLGDGLGRLGAICGLGLGEIDLCWLDMRPSMPPLRSGDA
jgi:hypothetical protein